ncbi:MAG: WecB/TagA/CpsF family glycosyltransferase [Candidatus Pacearchaeota archaeon]
MKNLFFSEKKDVIKMILESKKGLTFNFVNLHDLYWFIKNENFRKILSKNDNINSIDSFILSFLFSIYNLKKVERYIGTDFAYFILKNSRFTNKKHLFLGIKKEDSKRFYDKFKYLNQKNLFFYNPPYIKDLNFQKREIEKISKIINSKKIDFVWIGLGCPKQNFLSNELSKRVRVEAFFNVGAVLDFITEKKKMAPNIIRKIGLEWFYRFLTDFKHSRIKVYRSFIGLLHINRAKLRIIRQKPRILFIGRYPPPVHGAAVMNEFYFNSLKTKKIFEIERIIINKKGPLDSMGILNFKNFLWFIRSYIKTIKELIFFKPNLIYFELAPKGFAFYRDSFYVIIFKIFRKRILFHLHARGLEKNLYSKFIFRNTRIIILSKVLIEEVRDLFNKDKIYILPNGIRDMISNKEFDKIIKNRTKIKTRNLLFLSNMIEDKGTIDFLRICNYLKSKGLKFRAFFAGSWPDRKTKDRWFLIRNYLGLEQFCVYVGEKFNDEKRKILEQSHYMVFPTKYENESFPLVILESFMFGIPVFTYNNGALKEIVSANYLGKVFQIGKWDEIAKELEKTIKKNININNMKKIREHFKKNYTLNLAEKNLIKILNEETKNG